MRFGGIFDIENKIARLEQIQAQLSDPDLWKDPSQQQVLGKEKVQLEQVLGRTQPLKLQIQDAQELFLLASQEQDEQTLQSLEKEALQMNSALEALEFSRMFSGEMDASEAYLDVQAGSGGTEAQDWAEMLLRMYLRFCEHQGFSAEMIECSPGEVAGIKSATIKISSEYAYGWLRTEGGVHRLVRKSPFDANHKRHTSFASIYVYPEIDDNIAIEINPADLRIDTYRASGAGGQHVNRTDSAVRITHIPTNIVVQCQSDRSQHKNRAQAMKQLRAKLYELELQKQREVQSALASSKKEITWGSQIRSYVLDMARIKDLRTGVEVGNTQAVLDGDLKQFIEASLMSGI